MSQYNQQQSFECHDRHFYSPPYVYLLNIAPVVPEQKNINPCYKILFRN